MAFLKGNVPINSLIVPKQDSGNEIEVDLSRSIARYENEKVVDITTRLDGNLSNAFSNYQYNYNLNDFIIGENVINIYHTYFNCRSISGSPVCGNNITNTAFTYTNCFSLTGNPVCGPNVTNMHFTYYNCFMLTGSPVCGDKVTTMDNTYSNCRNITGNPVCGPNVTNMCSTYQNCHNITGSPVCGDKVTSIINTYSNCRNLTGSPVCGENVVNMAFAYSYCYNLIGSPVCGDKVTYMYDTYAFCNKLTGSPVCGLNVTGVSGTYMGCTNIGPNGYFYSNKINSATGCFKGKNNSRRLNLYVPSTGYNTTHNTLKVCLYNNGKSIISDQRFGEDGDITWTNDMSTNGYYYNTTYNIYIYPVDNVALARANNGD